MRQQSLTLSSLLRRHLQASCFSSSSPAALAISRRSTRSTVKHDSPFLLCLSPFATTAGRMGFFSARSLASGGPDTGYNFRPSAQPLPSFAAEPESRLCEMAGMVIPRSGGCARNPACRLPDPVEVTEQQNRLDVMPIGELPPSCGAVDAANPALII